MKQSNLKAWNKEDQEMVISTSNIECWFNEDKYTILRWCDCEDSEGTDIYEGDLIVDYYVDDNGDKKFVYYPVVWNQYELQWAVDVSFNRDMKTMEPLIAHTNSLVVGNIYQGAFMYGHKTEPTINTNS